VLCNFGGLPGNSAIACNKFLNFKIGPEPFDRGNMVFFCSRLKKQIVETLTI